MAKMEDQLPSTGRAKSARSSNPALGASSTSQLRSDRPSFTFIDHDDDLASKRIKDANARKAIRSHVMRDVRRRERLAGFKRVPKREDRATAGGKSALKSRERPARSSKERKLPMRSTSPSSSTSSSEAALDVVRFVPQRTPTTWILSEDMPRAPDRLPSVPRTWFLDPFCSLPGTNELPSMIESLVHYCTTVFIPMTFPTEHHPSRGIQGKLNMLGKSAFSDPGSFFGLMSVSAAHRAALTGRHSDFINASGSDSRIFYDPDYYVMKARCIREMNAKLQDPALALSDEAFNTIVNLLTCALIVGFFDEARIHLKGLKRMVELRGGITRFSNTDTYLVNAILTCDVKAAAGLMTKPVFPLIWEPQPLAPEVRQRIDPSISSRLHRLGVAVFGNTTLSPPLLNALRGLRNIAFFQHYNHKNPGGLSTGDGKLLFKLTHEAEHELLSYPYRSLDRASKEFGYIALDRLNPLEALVRVASICYLSYMIVVSPPPTGFGRALTKHLKQAANGCHLDVLSQLPLPCYNLVAWTLFIGAQGSLGQVERPWFVRRLAELAVVRGWKKWEDVADMLADYFYVPHVHDTVWPPIWEETMELFNVSDLGVG